MVGTIRPARVVENDGRLVAEGHIVCVGYSAHILRDDPLALALSTARNRLWRSVFDNRGVHWSATSGIGKLWQVA